MHMRVHKYSHKCAQASPSTPKHAHTRIRTHLLICARARKVVARRGEGGRQGGTLVAMQRVEQLALPQIPDLLMTSHIRDQSVCVCV